MDPPLYNICFPDIFGQVGSYLNASEVASIAKVNTHFAQFVKDSGLLYRYISLAFKQTKSRRKSTDDENVQKLLPCLERSPHNAATVTSLSVRHRFSGFLPNEEITYIERIATITKLCPSLSSLSLHLSNFATSYYFTDPNNSMKIPESATRPFFCQAFCDGQVSAQTPRVIDNLFAGLQNLRSLNWCVECRPSGLLSEDWKTSRLREELEIIDRACPKLEYLGLLNFFDTRVSDTIVHEMASNGTENFILDEVNAVSGILPKLQEITFYIGEERDQDKILSAAVLGMALGRWRGIFSKIVPWCQNTASQKLIIEDVTRIMKVQELMGKYVNTSLDEFIVIWGQYLQADVVFEICPTSTDTLQLDLVNLLSSQSRSVNIALKVNDLSPEHFHRIVLPPQTKSLSIETNCLPLYSIGHMIDRLNLQSLQVSFDNTFHDEKEEKVMMLLSRDYSNHPFTSKWASEPIMSFNMAIWGNMVACDCGENLFEAVVGRAIGQTTWESRKHLESITKDLFEHCASLRKVEIIASYPLYREELATPRLFKL